MFFSQTSPMTCPAWWMDAAAAARFLAITRRSFRPGFRASFALASGLKYWNTLRADWGLSSCMVKPMLFPSWSRMVSRGQAAWGFSRSWGRGGVLRGDQFRGVPDHDLDLADDRIGPGIPVPHLGGGVGHPGDLVDGPLGSPSQLLGEFQGSPVLSECSQLIS